MCILIICTRCTYVDRERIVGMWRNLKNLLRRRICFSWVCSNLWVTILGTSEWDSTIRKEYRITRNSDAISSSRNKCMSVVTSCYYCIRCSRDEGVCCSIWRCTNIDSNRIIFLDNTICWSRYECMNILISSRRRTNINCKCIVCLCCNS